MIWQWWCHLQDPTPHWPNRQCCLAGKRLPGFWFIQLPWVSIIHFMWNALLLLPSHFWVYYFSLSQCDNYYYILRSRHFMKLEVQTNILSYALAKPNLGIYIPMFLKLYITDLFCFDLFLWLFKTTASFLESGPMPTSTKTQSFWVQGTVFFFESRKCGNFHIVSTLQQFFTS